MLTIEVGGSSTQAILFDAPDRVHVVPLAQHRFDPWLLAAPGLVEGDRVRGAHHLGWMDARASRELGMAAPAVLSMGDANAAALGEWCLRGRPPGTWLYVGLGTGVGAAAVTHSTVTPVEFSHLTAFGPKRCDGCGRLGCLNAQIGGQALPTPLNDDDIDAVVAVLAAAIAQQEIALDGVVVGGGMARNYPRIVSDLKACIQPPAYPSMCLDGYKSAAPFGLMHTWQRHCGGSRDLARGS